MTLPAKFAATLWRDTDGNPFFVREVLLHLIETGGLVPKRTAGGGRSAAPGRGGPARRSA